VDAAAGAAVSAPSGDLSLFRSRVADLVSRAPVSCAPGASVVEVAKLMARERVGSAVVVDDDQRPLGIVTDRDLRGKVVGAGRDPFTTRAADIMSTPLSTIGPAAFVFDALLEMTRRDIHHLPVVDEGRLAGVLSSNDILRLQTIHPVLLARETAAADSIESVARLAARATPLVRRLVDEGGSAYDIGRIVAELNDRTVARVLELTQVVVEAAAGPAPPVAWCWLTFGSEARREQTLRTDQDNGLVYADLAPDAGSAGAQWVARFAEAAIDGLVRAGFPRCPGDVMASNPKWCQPRSAWEAKFRRWIEHPAAEELLAASIFFDLRPLAGTLALGDGLAEVISAQARGAHVFLAQLARDVVSRPVPLTIFGSIGTTSSGAHRGRVDVKAAGSQQIVGAARVAALECGIRETNTVDRLMAAAQTGLYTISEAREITDAYQHLMRLRLVHQLAQLEAGEEADNYVDPRRLSRADALLFRDALKTVARVQEALAARFGTARMLG
jgi:CBS domain-containing protein